MGLRTGQHVLEERHLSLGKYMTVEERIQLTLGQQMMQIVILLQRLEESEKKIAELELKCPEVVQGV